MKTTYYRNVKDTSLKAQNRFRAGSWIHLQTPTEDEIADIIKTLHLEPGHVRDAIDPDEMPRLEIEGDTTYVFTRYTYTQESRILTAPILFVVGPTFVLTVTPQRFPGLDALIKNSTELITTQKTKLLVQLLRHCVGTYTTGLTTINRQIRGARARLNVMNITNRSFVQFVGLEDALNDFLTELVPTNSILSSLLGSRQNLTFYEDDKDLIEDLVLSTRQSIELSKSNLRTIVNIREAYSNIMTNNLNRQIKVLTSLTIILTIPTIVGTFFGMNVEVPFNHTPAAFALIVGGTLGVCATLVWLFNRNRWL